ncbi:hypothetical protein N658DRAFT_555499 [Parathielavia hyrcaniae]|uniref:RING-type domain-containing protein n=1 Tax=Parathielavia hyrcaniae TaxID=113614 RepID=A0AAN6QBU1_9PEZI|nr:hypothetical protein N658DRAFT_555499 [Parathielavia hyrcaniae]
MAASLTLTEAQTELINSLPQEDIPAKLRCAICSKLAVNAFRLPCCEQAICENCQSTLPLSCPVCEHSPLSADDCKPHKALRTTIKVFLRTEEKKRESSRPKDVPVTPVTPVDPSPISASAPAIPEPALNAEGTDAQEHQQPTVEKPATDAGVPVEVQEGGDAVPEKEGHGGAKKTADGAEQPSHNATDDAADAEPEAIIMTDVAPVPHGSELVEAGDAQEAKEVEENGDENEAGPQGSGIVPPAGMSGAFPTTGFAPGFDQMQMMMAMQNGFGNFPPMMGMPGMNMDPMTMQMYMNGGFQGMGMNGMNMNMGMGGYGGEADNWSGQQSWNVGQDNYNHPSASGMGNGDYGSLNSGFQTGYNQGNYGHQNQFNDYRRNQYGFRGRGRGRGYGYGYGRGGYQHGYGNGSGSGSANWNDQGYEAPPYQSDQADHQGSGETNPDANVDEFGRSLRGGDAGQEGDAPQEQVGGEDAPAITNQEPPNEGAEGAEGSVPPPPNPDVPLNAPKGPKAMLRGLPNTSILHLQARGWVDDDKSPTPSSAAGTGFDRGRSRSTSLHGSHRGRYHSERHQDRSRERDYSGRDRHRDRERDRDRGKDRERSSSRSRSRSRSHDRREHRRSRRQRSYSPGPAEGEERESGDERRRHRSSHRKKHSSHGAGEEREPTKPHRDEPEQDGRARSASPVAEDSQRRSHRSNRKERDSEKRRERDRDRDRGDRDKDRDEHRRRSHRSHRDRDHDRDREKDRDRDRDRERDRDRDRERDRDRDKERDRKDRHRDRDRDRERDRDRTRDRDRDRDRDRGRESRRDRDKDRHHHRSSKPTSAAAEPPSTADTTTITNNAETNNNELNPAQGGGGGAGGGCIEIKGAAAATAAPMNTNTTTTSTSGDVGTNNSNSNSNSNSNNNSNNHSHTNRRSSLTSNPNNNPNTTSNNNSSSGDAHAAERAARDRERLLRETRRMASLTGLAGSKRSREVRDGGGAGGGGGGNGGTVNGGGAEEEGGGRKRSRGGNNLKGHGLSLRRGGSGGGGGGEGGGGGGAEEEGGGRKRSRGGNNLKAEIWNGRMNKEAAQVSRSQPESVDAPTPARTDDGDTDRPVRVLVQTRTHLVPGDKSTDYWERIDAMERLIGRHVWQRNLDRLRERTWHLKCHFVVPRCRVLGTSSPGVLLTSRSGVTIHGPLPRSVRRELRHYPFERNPHRHKPLFVLEPGATPPRRKFRSHSEEVRIRRSVLRDCLLEGSGMSDALVEFAIENPDVVEWVRARVPPETWGRLDHVSGARE